MSRHYLDHASTSPTRPEAIEAMTSFLAEGAGDPSRIHHEGMTARALIEHARSQVAELVGARSREVVLSSGATESIAAAVFGAAERGSHMVVPRIEHSAVRLQAERFCDVSQVDVDEYGRVDPGEVVAAIRPDTALVNLQWGNHEVGTTQPITEVAAACRERDVLLHVDAAQAVGRVPVDFAATGADLLSFSGHKFGAPAGTGGLLIRRGLRIRPLLVGGEQERLRRAGFENAAAIVGLGSACQVLAGDSLERGAVESRRSTDRVLNSVPELDGVCVYGDPVGRLPHILCLGVAGIEPQAVLLALDRRAIAVHSGSSCASESLEPSPVLEAMGVDAHHSLRISVGWSTTEADIDALLGALPEVISELHRLGGQS